MQTQSAQLLKEAWSEAFNGRDKDRFVSLHSESVTFHDPTFPKPLHGRQELGEWFEGLFKMFPDCRMEVGRTYGLGDWVCAECIESGTMRGPIRHPKGEVAPTGRSYRINAVLVCRVDGGLISEVRGFYDAVELMTQLGLQV